MSDLSLDQKQAIAIASARARAAGAMAAPEATAQQEQAPQAPERPQWNPDNTPQQVIFDTFKEVGKGIAQPILHPIDTAKGLYNLATDDATQTAFVDHFKNRYGSVQGLSDDFVRNPSEVLAELGGFLTGGAGLAKAGIKVAPKAARLASEAIGAPAIAEVVSGAAKNATAPMAERLAKDYTAQAARQMGKAAGRDNMSATQIEARLAELGPQGMIADTGPNMMALAETAAQRPGKALTTATEGLGARQEGQGERLANLLDTRMDSREYGGTMDNLMKGRSAAGGPAYEALYSKYDNISTPHLERLVKDEPLVKKGLATAFELERIRHNSVPDSGPFNPQEFGVVDFNAAGDPILGNITTLKQWNHVKMGLDAMLKGDDPAIINQTTGVLTTRGKAISDFRKSIVAQLDKRAPGDPAAGVPSYAEVRGIWAGPSRAAEMMQEGMDFIKRGKSSLDVDEVKALPQADKDFMRVGAKQQLKDIIANAGDGADAVKRIFGNKMMRSKIEAMFPDKDEFKLLARDLGGEGEMFETGTNVLKNSRTAFRQNAAEDAAGGTPVGLIGNLLTGNVTGAAKSLVPNVVRKMTGPNPKVADELAALFSTDKPTQMEYLNRMRQLEAMRAGNPKLTRAQSLARTIGGPNQ